MFSAPKAPIPQSSRGASSKAGKSRQATAKNMVDPNVTETAVAIARSPRTDYYYAVQLFGKPKSQMVEFKVANRTGVRVEYALDGQIFQLPARATITHQVCKQPVVQFHGKTLQPASGQQLVIVNDQNGMQVQVQ